MEVSSVAEFLSQNSLFVVLIVVLVIWVGILWYLFRIEKRVSRIEQDSKKS
jgi:CcmD family protein